MSLSFIGAAILLIVMIAFMLTTIKILISVVSKRIYDNVVNMLYIYDDLFDKRKQKIREISHNNDNVKDERASRRRVVERDVMLSPSLSVVGESVYYDHSFLEKYQTIKNGLVLDKNLIVSNIIYARKAGSLKPSFNISEVMSLDSLYLLSTISPMDQFRVLQEVFEGTALDAFEEYISTYNVTNNTFDSIDFYQKQKQKTLSTSDTIIVKTSDEKDDFSQLAGNLITQFDKELCEGIKIITSDKCFDFGISRKELHSG